MFVYPSGSSAGYGVSVRVYTNTGGGRTIVVKFTNTTVGASVNVPGFTFNCHAHFYAFPF